MESFRDQVAVITGGSGGVGRSLGEALGRAGATVCLVGRNRERLEESVRRLRYSSTGVASFRADLNREDQIARLADFVREELGRLDLLIHGAAIIALGKVEDTRKEDLNGQFRTNVRAPFLLTRALLPELRARRGQVVFVNSSAGLKAGAGVGSYAATKHALKALADSLRDEVNEDGVRVLSVFLGRTATPMQAEIHRVEGRPYEPERLIQPEHVADILAAVLSSPRSLEVTDINVRPMKKIRPVP